MRAVQIEEFGGPEVLKVAELATPEPCAGELLVKVSRAGINFADTHQRQNDYLAKFELPLIPGAEVAAPASTAGGGFSRGRPWAWWSAAAATRSTRSLRPPAPSRSPTGSTTPWPSRY